MHRGEDITIDSRKLLGNAGSRAILLHWPYITDGRPQREKSERLFDTMELSVVYFVAEKRFRIRNPLSPALQNALCPVIPDFVPERQPSHDENLLM